MQLLITRPAIQAAETLSALQARGWQGVLSPLLEIEQIRPDRWPDWAQITGILITSRNAIPALSAGRAPTSLPIYCVGGRTAAAIEAAGYKNIAMTAATAAELAEQCAETSSLTDARIAYLCGENRRSELEDYLNRAAIAHQTVEVYRAVGHDHLTDAACTGLVDQQIDGVLLYSPRSATLFVKALANCLKGRALLDLTNLQFFCLSAAVAEALTADWPFPTLTPQQVRIAAQPNEDALLQLVARGSALRPNA